MSFMGPQKKKKKNERKLYRIVFNNEVVGKELAGNG
jgi:hypothetical protein